MLHAAQENWLNWTRSLSWCPWNNPIGFRYFSSSGIICVRLTFSPFWQLVDSAAAVQHSRFDFWRMRSDWRQEVYISVYSLTQGFTSDRYFKYFMNGCIKSIAACRNNRLTFLYKPVTEVGKCYSFQVTGKRFPIRPADLQFNVFGEPTSATEPRRVRNLMVSVWTRQFFTNPGSKGVDSWIPGSWANIVTRHTNIFICSLGWLSVSTASG